MQSNIFSYCLDETEGTIFYFKSIENIRQLIKEGLFYLHDQELNLSLGCDE